MQGDNRALLLGHQVQVRLCQIARRIGIAPLNGLENPAMLPTNRLPIQILRHHTQPVVSLKMRIDALHPIPQHMAAGNHKTRLMEQVVQVKKTTRFAMVERLGLGKNLLKPLLLLGRSSRTTFNEYASFELFAQETVM